MSDLRMPDLNRVILAGRLTRDPELKYTPSGTAVCKMGLAVTRTFKGKDGEKREETLFVDLTAWEKSAEYYGQHLRKGRPVIVEGRLRSDTWDDKTTGQKRSKIEITVMRLQQLDWEDRGGGGGAAASSRPEPREIEEPIPEDDIPF
ncbi:MAG TPA: single-stranded DNA-binding protein [Candidatus Hydrogenedentes bacterium]|nr:single-stranded DNA-binding protein [Candidatus Hydrogenedentota bacterium]HOV73042.1 single-stranded DNA-binding protein [Candidatus Hydrogenedentota bacterium]HPC14782.1 single-stranded DNA-binding protein [Candidatus Hydrogenedentota bacterium]HRT18646.1 single-stranded DNA-binding protein [Candidatus Hydrogenedentota bacterium]HRT63666.1 single-stranded DNA-binding protein [Candidatus Hydrogenedentota bacterium]